MIMLSDGKKVTAKQFAANLISTEVNWLINNWKDDMLCTAQHEDILNRRTLSQYMTEKELADTNRHFAHYRERVAKLLNL